MNSTNSFNHLLLYIFFYLGFTGNPINGNQLPFFLFPKTCLTEDCHKIGVELAHSLNSSREPCINFYKHVCDNWSLRNEKPKSEPLWNQYLATTYEISGNLQKVLETRGDGIENAKIFYKNCVGGGGENREKYTRQLRNFIEKLGGWRNFSYLQYEPLRHVVEVTRLLDIHPILKFHVNTDFTNTTKNILYMEPGDFVFPESFLVNAERYENELKIYTIWMRETLGEIYDEMPDNFAEETERVVNFEVNLAKINEREHTKRKVDVEELPVYASNYWKNIFKVLFQSTTQFPFADSIDEIVTKPNYLEKLFQLFSKTNLHTISNYIIWCAIKDLARETSVNLREINFRVDHKILKVSADLDRRHECVQHALKYFASSLLKGYLLENYFDRRNVRRVERIAENIRTEFLRHLRGNSWLTAETKQWVVEKILSVRFEIGFPKYESVEYTKELTSNHLLNTLRLKSYKSKISLEELSASTKRIKWPIHVFEVNAYYSILQNAIILPLGILSPPFYDPRRGDVFNYGALGTLIGHEISHALDTNGRMGNQHGIIGEWWSKEDSQSYDERSECFKKKYDGYGIDGSFTMGENVADNVGLRLSFGAMLRDKELNDGISVFHRKQIFFIRFGQLWCEISHDGNDLHVQEEHSPVEIRVLATLTNFDPFNYIYNCKQDNICRLW